MLIGVPFNDAYRYMGWLSTVLLPLVEILVVMKLDEADCESKAWILGLGYTLMIVFGYYGELGVTGDLSSLWDCWSLLMAFFCYSSMSSWSSLQQQHPRSLTLRSGTRSRLPRP